jgi:hypothetical protein
MWRRAAWLVLAALSIIVALVYLIDRGGQAPRQAAAPASQRLGGVRAGRQSSPPHQPIPVAANRGPEVLDGFQGDVHPLLFGRTRLEVTARWTPVGKGRDQLHRAIHPKFYSWFTELKPTRAQQTYTEADFSAFLPAAVGEVGQLWALDADKIARILKQFHPHPSLHLVAAGRRAGPDGAFAILRAVAPSHLDIVFRLHAELYLTPDAWPADGPLVQAWYTPAYFAGRVLVNRRTGTVEHFWLGLATDKALNVHLTINAPGFANVTQPRGIVRVEHMELTGGDARLVEKVPRTKALKLVRAAHVSKRPTKAAYLRARL